MMIQTYILRTTKTPKKNSSESRQYFLFRLMIALAGIMDDHWYSLPGVIQIWYNKNVGRLAKSKSAKLIDFGTSMLD